MPRMTAAEAGAKGGRSRSAKKLVAIKRNGFQPTPKPADAQPAPKSPALLVVPKQEGQ